MTSGERPVVNLSQEAEVTAQRGDVQVLERTEKEPLDLRKEDQEARGTFKTVTGLQRAGIQFAWPVLIAILVVTAVAGLDWIIGGPEVPQVPANSTTTQAQIQNFQALRETDQERPRQLFTVVVTSGLLPVFTLLLGYIFGKESNQFGP